MISTASAARLSRVRGAIRREDTVLRYPVNGDNWHMTWGRSDRQFVGLCDGVGLERPPKIFYNSRMLSIKGGPLNAQFDDVASYPVLGRPAQRPSDARYYGFGILAIDSCIYQFLSTFDRPIRDAVNDKPDLSSPMRFVGAKLIYSTDDGLTWRNQDGSTPVAWESWDQRGHDTMVFFEEEQAAFSLLSIVQMGKNYEHNRDGYVYVMAPNGDAEGTMNELVMFRAPKDKLLHRRMYEYFAGGHGNDARWTSDIAGRQVVHRFPSGWVNTLLHPYAWHPSVVYNHPLGIYMMANWGMGTAKDGGWFARPSYLGLWIAEFPWGPWVQVHEETKWLPAADENARTYQPQISPRWISPDGKSFWLIWTDFQVTNKELESVDTAAQLLSIRSNRYSEVEVVRSANRMREFMPYYSFNLQRVDLVVAQ